MNNHFYVVIMAGGIGSRFWPYSRNNRPKQFLDVLGVGASLLQLTFRRFRNICPIENIYIVTSEAYENAVLEQIPEIFKDQVLLEPTRRNTAPCIAYASYKIRQKDPDAIMVVTPADHAIIKESEFIEVLKHGLQYAQDREILITLGIHPDRPETGYGYIQFHFDSENAIKKVKTFTEKPELELAKKFIESGDFVWNAGIFIWNVRTIIKAFEKHLPELAELFENITGDLNSEKEKKAIQKVYSVIKIISIDYGIMEKADNVFVILTDVGWSDLGSWASLHDIKEKDKNNNVIEANALAYESGNSIVIGPKGKLIVIEGLDGYLVADCDDVLLICKKDNEARIRAYVKDVRNKKGDKYI
ncbi:MAG TPA: mannose-1-phosphate guanylyltransferase [Cyclobacteriaceae bacterium]|nr:mannose-1-phosphate guanylyltransferase [Cyclobacteriaceae bacterium]